MRAPLGALAVAICVCGLPAGVAAAKHKQPFHLAAGKIYKGSVHFQTNPPSKESFQLRLAKDGKSMSLVGAFGWSWWGAVGGSCSSANLAISNYLIGSKHYRKTHPYKGGPEAQAPPSISVNKRHFSGSETLDYGDLQIAGRFTGSGKSVSGNFRFTVCGSTLVLPLKLKAK